MGLLTKAVNEQAYLKAGLLGFPGSGKTYTATMLAIGIAQRLGGNKPVAFFDTETGSDFLIPRFEAEGIDMLRVKSQAFADLLAAGKEAESACSVLIVDSITHVWRELCEAYQRKRNIRRMEFQHWGDVKREWSAWTTFYLNAQLHIIVCGRAGYDYDFDTTEDGKKELVKAGTKMKVESEFGFEPSLLIEMERVARDVDQTANAKNGRMKRHVGGEWMHRAHILKDRTDTINGKHFDFGKPNESYTKGDWAHTMNPFTPVLDALAIGKPHVGLDTSRTSDGLFDANGRTDRQDRAIKVSVALETIQNTMVLLWPGQDAKSKTAKIAILEALFNVRAWAAVEKMSLETLETGVTLLRAMEPEIASADGVLDPAALKALADTCRDVLADAGKPSADEVAMASASQEVGF